MKVSERRERNRPLRVVVSEAERAKIEGLAAGARLSVSAYLRILGLGYQPQSTVDKEAILALARVAGDQGRLGGLLKVWLRDQAGEGASEHDVAKLLDQLVETQADIRQLVRRL